MNVIFKNRTFELEEIPKVGFLIIPHISLEDQGDYWCSLNGEDEQNKVFRIRVAYIHPFPDNKLVSKPDSPQRTQTVIIDCPKTNAFPEPLISWQFVSRKSPFARTLLLERWTSWFLKWPNWSRHQWIADHSEISNHRCWDLSLYALQLCWAYFSTNRALSPARRW